MIFQTHVMNGEEASCFPVGKYYLISNSLCLKKNIFLFINFYSNLSYFLFSPVSEQRNMCSEVCSFGSLLWTHLFGSIFSIPSHPSFQYHIKEIHLLCISSPLSRLSRWNKPSKEGGSLVRKLTILFKLLINHFLISQNAKRWPVDKRSKLHPKISCHTRQWHEKQKTKVLLP